MIAEPYGPMCALWRYSSPERSGSAYESERVTVPARSAGGALRPGDHYQRRAASSTRPELASAEGPEYAGSVY